MIQLYDPSLSLSERQELFFELESLGEAMPNRHICSSFHFLMGRILFSQVNNASDRHWRRLELANLGIAEGGGW